MYEDILLTGGKGRLGSIIKSKYPEIKSFDKFSLDVTDRKKVLKIVVRENPNYIINCAAITDVEYCETHPLECWKVNTIGVRNLAEAANMVGANLIHFSSNYALNPVNEYGWSKLASESIVAQNGLVLRTDIYYTSTFLIRKLLFTKERVGAYTNVFFNPISAYSLVKILFKMLDKKGIFNIGTKEKITPYAFALKVCKTFGLDQKRVFPSKLNKTCGVKRPAQIFLIPHNHLSIESDLRVFKDELEKQKNLGNSPSSR